MTTAALLAIAVALNVGQALGLFLMWRFVRIFGAYHAHQQDHERQRLVAHEQQQFLHREFVRLHGEQVRLTETLQRLKERA